MHFFLRESYKVSLTAYKVNIILLHIYSKMQPVNMGGGRGGGSRVRDLGGQTRGRRRGSSGPFCTWDLQLSNSR